MGWDRQGKFRYYTRTIYSNGKFTREYIGRGPLAELVAQVDDLERATRRWQRQAIRKMRAEWRAVEQASLEFEAHLMLVTRATLLAAGFQQHARGQWRTRRMNNQPKTCEDQQHLDLETLVARAQAGDQSTLLALRRLLDDDPIAWERYGDLAAHAESAWLGLLAPVDLVLKESLKRKADEMRNGLLRDGDSSLEQLLVDRVVLTWLQVCAADTAASKVYTHPLPQQLRTELARRQDAANTRHLAAIKQLALVRKLLSADVFSQRPRLRAVS